MRDCLRGRQGGRRGQGGWLVSRIWGGGREEGLWASGGMLVGVKGEGEALGVIRPLLPVRSRDLELGRGKGMELRSRI